MVTTSITKSFIKESHTWYIDLPDFIEQGLGSKANLMMVQGADTLLDRLSNNGNKITLTFSTHEFPSYEYVIHKKMMGIDKEYLDRIGHAPVEYGAYYKLDEWNHTLWLCPVTEYVFGGNYPEAIYIKVVA
ncbi:MAG: hypothetical protein QM528_00550 [Phycisphaerales bacterium]|nr:hypothetical protein [Phycisphaerales bacterium]